MKRLLLAFLMVLLLGTAAWACPMCAEAGAANVTDPATAERLRGGFSASLGLLLSTPYMLFGGITLMVARSARRKKLSDGRKSS